MLELLGSTVITLALWAGEERWRATYISHVIQDAFIHEAMCLLCVPHAENLPVRYGRRLFLDPRMAQSPDKVSFEYRCLACFERLLPITFGCQTEPVRSEKPLASVWVLQ